MRLFAHGAWGTSWPSELYLDRDLARRRVVELMGDMLTSGAYHLAVLERVGPLPSSAVKDRVYWARDEYAPDEVLQLSGEAERRLNEHFGDDPLGF